MKHIPVALIVLLMVLLVPLRLAQASQVFQSEQEPCPWGDLVDYPNGETYAVGIRVKPGCVVGRTVTFQLTGFIVQPPGYRYGPAEVQVSFLGQTSDWVAVSPTVRTPVTFDNLPAVGGSELRFTTIVRRPGDSSSERLLGGGKLTQDATPPDSFMTQRDHYSGKNLILRWDASDEFAWQNMRFDVDARVGTSGAWQPLYRDTIAREGSYSGKNGQHVYFRVRATDDLGNVEPWSDTPDAEVIFDTVAPTGVVDISFVGTGSVQALIAAEDNLSGVTEMRVGRRDTIKNADWQPFAQTVTVSRLGARPGCVEVAIQLRDDVKNASEVIYTPVPGTGCNGGSGSKVYVPMVRW